MNTVVRDVNFYMQYDFEVCRWDQWDYSLLSHVRADQPRGREKDRINECFIMLDTETSKTKPDQYHIAKDGRKVYEDNVNYVVKWSLAINAYGINVVCLWGDKPSECLKCVENVEKALSGDLTVIYIHNLSYDWLFLRKFMMREWGEPVYQLNTKPHYPIIIRFTNGIELRDSLILAQRSIEKWGTDMNVLHRKSVGNWDYEKIRNQSDDLTDEEKQYISNDVICGVECLDAMRKTLRCRVAGMPHTATGIVRNEARLRGVHNKAHEKYVNTMGDFDWYLAAEKCYHGGYTHGNRHYIGSIEEEVTAYDFASSYPYVMLSEKYPKERFVKVEGLTLADVLNTSYAVMLELCAYDVELKDYCTAMPVLQSSKCEVVFNPRCDNGRILRADLIDIYITEVDLQMIMDQYNLGQARILNAWVAAKDYLPVWLTDYVYELYKDKTMLKGVDQIRYNIAKAKLNSIYGMTVQRVCRDEIIENYLTGEFSINEKVSEQEYIDTVNRKTSFLPYSIGVYVTAYAQRNLFRLGSCCETWLYSDTDSIYGYGWDKKKLNDYNSFCKKILTARGYKGIEHNGKEYWLGVAEKDGDYSEFVTLGAKRYCCRDVEKGKLKITVAGVPKKAGAECLEDDIKHFRRGFVFPGDRTGKLTHIYQYVDDIGIDDNGNEYADSVNLVPCDYLLDDANIDDMFYEEVAIPTYGDDTIL